MDKKNDFTNMKCIKVFFGITVFVLVFLFLVGQIVYPSERDVLSTNCKEFQSEWYQVLDSGKKAEVEVPGKVEAQYGEIVTVATMLPEQLEDNTVICFRSIWQDVEVYVEDELRVSYNTKDTRPFGKNSAFRYVFVELSKEDAGHELRYCFSSESKYAGNIRNCYIGDKLGIWTHLIEESGSRTIIILFLLFLSLFCIFVCEIMKYIYKKALPLTYLVWTMLFCSIWMLSEVEFRQIIFKNVSILTYYTYISLMIIPVPLLIYINEIQNGRYKKIHMVPIIYSIVIFFATTFLQIFNVAEYVQVLPLMHIGIITAIVATIVTIFIDVVKKRISDYTIVGIGVCGLLVSAMGEMLLYYIDLRVSIGTVLAIGLMFLLVMAIIKTGQDLMKSEKKKQEAIVAREAQAKFLANMSHEIRTPINAVIGMDEMILRECDDADIREYAGNIKRASNMLLGLVNDILDFSKIESGQFELVEEEYDLVPLIKDEKLILSTRAGGKPISIIVEVDSNLPSRLVGDELRIKQIITNLISNAVKYTKEGSVTLKVFYEWIGADIIKLCFSVTDTGIGIKKEDISKLFDNFKRLEIDKNRNIQGTGLGLSIAKQLTELMNGDIVVVSEYGKGSKFTLSIPQKVVDRKPIGDIEDILNSTSANETTQSGIFVAPEAKILIVDDNAMNLSVIKALLKQTQIKVDTATSGKECLKMTSHKKYDMILLDHMMPELDGVATLKIMRDDKNNPNRNGIIIALTANAVAGCREMYLEYGFTDYFSKPIQADKFDEMLLKYLPNDLIYEANGKVNTKAESGKEFAKEKECKIMEKGNGFVINESMLIIDKEIGLSYCMDLEDVYKDVLEIFCEQCEEYYPELDECVKNKDWKKYAIITHGLKSNAKNIGAMNFAELSFNHETAGKNDDGAYILAEYEGYLNTLKALENKVKSMV